MTNSISNTLTPPSFGVPGNSSGSDSGNFFDELSRAQSSARRSLDDSASNPKTSWASKLDDTNQSSQQSGDEASGSQSADETSQQTSGTTGSQESPQNNSSDGGDSSTQQPNQSNIDSNVTAQDATSSSAHAKTDPANPRKSPQIALTQDNPVVDQTGKGVPKGKKTAGAIPNPDQPQATDLVSANSNQPVVANPTVQTSVNPTGSAPMPPGAGNADANGKSSGRPNVSPFQALPGQTSPDDASSGNLPAANLAGAADSNVAKGHAADKLALTDNSSLPAPFAQELKSRINVDSAPLAAPAPNLPVADAQFAPANHPGIVSAIHGDLLPGGGTMQIHLDPPELGAMHISVTMDQGAMSASFETSNDQATRLLTHSLGDLKAALETQGVSVQSLHVRQSSPGDNASNQTREDANSGRQNPADDSNSRQQQRREMLRRMWQRVSGGQDPLDLVA